MKYTDSSKYKLVCPSCGGTEFYYNEIRTIKVQVDMLHTDDYPAKNGSKVRFADLFLGQDYPDQGGGEVPDEYYDHGKLYCSECHTEIGWRNVGLHIELANYETKNIDEQD